MVRRLLEAKRALTGGPRRRVDEFTQRAPDWSCHRRIFVTQNSKSGVASHANAVLPLSAPASINSGWGKGLAVIKSNTIAMLIISVLILIVPVSLQAQSARDPGPRVGADAVGKPLDD